MRTAQFLEAYNASRNGTDSFHTNPLYRIFLYSDGVRECAEAGCYWLLDILGTELPEVFRCNPQGLRMSVSVVVDDMCKCAISGTFSDDQADKPPYFRVVEWTDMPTGTWEFFVAKEGGKLVCILLSEY